MENPNGRGLVRGNLCVLIGPSGAGKSTLIHVVEELDKRVAFIKSVTTRQKERGTEHSDRGQEDEDEFVTVEEFKRRIQLGLFLEYQIVHGQDYYGSSLKRIEGRISAGKDGITYMDVLGAALARIRLARDLLTIFVSAPTIDDLRARLQQRGDSPDAIDRRLSRAPLEMRFSDWFDLAVCNADVGETARYILAVIRDRRRQKRVQLSEAGTHERAVRTAQFVVPIAGSDAGELGEHLKLPLLYRGSHAGNPRDLLQRVLDLLRLSTRHRLPETDFATARVSLGEQRLLPPTTTTPASESRDIFFVSGLGEAAVRALLASMERHAEIHPGFD